ncbi:putative sucrose-phosphatase 2 [Zea mays]|uniref:Putative sucrose-phosphatase 2 n=1 Tax=Zea mays TaxID=4577 RepID=A0A1D6LFW2_MAIZE|nr:putative sucrose-phosphatase 2 [Zea mays]AQK78816.1 putative sucrose-phosphatase 2 [Zea mays]
MLCAHIYHAAFILLKLALRNSCPICRHEMPTDAALRAAASVGVAERAAGEEQAWDAPHARDFHLPPNLIREFTRTRTSSMICWTIPADTNTIILWQEITILELTTFASTEEFDTHDPKENTLLLPYLRKRSKIIEIVAARDIVFALSQLGVCAAFSSETNQRICFLNGSLDEVIRNLFYNKNNDSFKTVSVYGSENFSALRCRITRIEYVRRGQDKTGCWFPSF